MNTSLHLGRFCMDDEDAVGICVVPKEMIKMQRCIHSVIGGLSTFEDLELK